MTKIRQLGSLMNAAPRMYIERNPLLKAHQSAADKMKRNQPTMMIGFNAVKIVLLFALLPISLVTTRLEAEERKQQIDYSAELPRVPALEPEQAMKRIEVAEGFEIQLVASEPLVTSPVAIEWDAVGGMFVCEMRGYSENRDDAISRIRYLTDSNHDGTYDQATVYADKLLWPTAIFPYKGGLFVADAPDIFYYKDADGDGVAEYRKHILTGFGFSNVQGLFNSFRWGLDNQIHIACSSVGGMIHPPGRAQDSLNVRGRDLSFDPDTYAFRVTSGGAQHGMCFDDWGRKFASSNSDHIQQVIYEDRYLARSPFVAAPSARRSIALDGPQAPVFRISPVEPWRIVRTRLRVGGVVPGPVEGGGRPSGYFTGATGITIYRGDNWEQQYRGVAIVGDVGSNLIHRKRIEQKSIEMIAKRMDPSSEFVRSSDIWFRPAQFANAPDGTLHVVDVCREVIEHPKSLPPEIKQHLDLNSGRDRGRIYRIMKKGSVIRRNPNLKELNGDQLIALLDHRNAWHRETASRLLYEQQDTANIPKLIEQSNLASLPQGRIHALHALKGLKGLTTECLSHALNDTHHQVRRHALLLLEDFSDKGKLNDLVETLANDPNAETRYQLAFSIAEYNHPRKSEILTRLALENSDSPWLQLAILSSAGEGASEVFANLVTQQSFRTPAAAEMLVKLSQLIVRQNQPDRTRVALASLETLSTSDPQFALPILGTYRTVKNNPDATVRFTNTFSRLIGKACQQALDSGLSNTARLKAIDSLGFGNWKEVGSTLQKIIQEQEDPSLTDRALSIAVKFQEPVISEWLINDWGQQTPQRRKLSIEAIFSRPERIKHLFTSISSGDVPINEIPRSRYTAAANSRDPIIKARALEFLRQTATASRDDVFKIYQTALRAAADPVNGKMVFRKHCASCHRIEEMGYQLGPNLASVKSRGPEAILINVLDPNLEVNPQYINYLMLKTDGATATGMIVSENATSVTLKRAEGVTESVLREDIEQMQSSKKSIMPEGLEKSISPQEMADLISYLMKVQ